MRKITGAVVLVLLTALLLCGCSGGSVKWFDATVLSISDEVVTVAPNRFGFAGVFGEISVPTDTVDSATLAELGFKDEVMVVYTGTFPKMKIQSCELAKKQLQGVLLEIKNGYAYVRPTVSEGIPKDTEQIRFRLRGLEDIGVQVGREVRVTYVRDIVQGMPPSLDVRDWEIAEVQVESN